MAGRRREALGWGLVGALAFLVLALGYQLFADATIDLLVLVGVAALVFVATSAAAYLARPRIE